VECFVGVVMAVVDVLCVHVVIGGGVVVDVVIGWWRMMMCSV